MRDEVDRDLAGRLLVEGATLVGSRARVSRLTSPSGPSARRGTAGAAGGPWRPTVRTVATRTWTRAAHLGGCSSRKVRLTPPASRSSSACTARSWAQLSRGSSRLGAAGHGSFLRSEVSQAELSGSIAWQQYLIASEAACGSRIRRWGRCTMTVFAGGREDYLIRVEVDASWGSRADVLCSTLPEVCIRWRMHENPLKIWYDLANKLCYSSDRQLKTTCR